MNWTGNWLEGCVYKPFIYTIEDLERAEKSLKEFIDNINKETERINKIYNEREINKVRQ